MNRDTLISERGLFIAVLILITGTTIGLILTQRTPAAIAPLLTTILSTVPQRMILISLGFPILGATLIRLIRNPPKENSNPEIVPTTPETPVDKSIPQLRESQLMSPFDSESWFGDEKTDHNRQYAMYGRRIETEEEIEVPTELAAIIAELTITARDTYATAHDCSQEQASREIARGTWTNNRQVATFLATEVEPDKTGFTTWERLKGWIFTEKMIDKRITQTIQCINELQAENYLSHTVTNGGQTDE